MSQHTASAILAEDKITFSKTVACRSSIVTLAKVCSSKLSLAVCGYWSVPCHHEVSGERGRGDIFLAVHKSQGAPLNQCIRISTQNEARDLIIAWACDTLPFSSPSVIEFGLDRYHDGV